MAMDARVSPELRALLDKRRRIIEGVTESISLTDCGGPGRLPDALRRPGRTQSGLVPVRPLQLESSIKGSRRYRRISAPVKKIGSESTRKGSAKRDDDPEAQLPEIDQAQISRFLKGLTERTTTFSTVCDEASEDDVDASANSATELSDHPEKQHARTEMLDDLNSLSDDCKWHQCYMEMTKEGQKKFGQSKTKMSVQLDALRRRQESSLEQMNSKLVALQQKIQQVRAGDRVELEASRKQLALNNDTIETLRARVAQLELENESLRRPVQHSGLLIPDQQFSGGPSSEGVLRHLMTDQTATSDALKEAVLSVEALVSEARREMEKKQQRERRAVYEQLYAAIEKSDEAQLERLIVEAQRTEIDAQDIEKADAKLQELRSMSDEQRHAKEAHKRKAKLKEQAFVLVKRDNATQLKELLDGVAAEFSWPDWKDYAGRTLWRCSVELRATAVQHYLAPVLGQTLPGEGAKMARRASAVSPKAVEVSADLPRFEAPPPEPSPLPEVPSQREDNLETEPVVAAPVPVVPENVVVEPAPVKRPSVVDESTLKPKAFRAVVQDDVEALEAALQGVSPDIWSAWRNKAGKDLLSLSEERGSTNAYRTLAKDLGLLQEMVAETYEEREAVWIFLPGEVQPLRATVLEDVPESAELILVEFWDGDDPPSQVERCLVRKMAT